MDKICPTCLITFHVKPSHFSWRICCSRKCCSAVRRKKMLGNKNPSKRPEVRAKLHRIVSTEEREAIRKRMSGVPKTQTCKDRISKAKTGIPNYNGRGVNCFMWKGGISEKNMAARNSLEFAIWRKIVFSRDNWLCRRCHQRGGRLHAHHILNFSSKIYARYFPSNGITLCRPCHREFHRKYGITKNTVAQTLEFIQSKT